jgi:hypothetical protein
MGLERNKEGNPFVPVGCRSYIVPFIGEDFGHALPTDLLVVNDENAHWCHKLYAVLPSRVKITTDGVLGMS